ncbi:DNA repair-scaffolding protein isoform X2 [Hypomesus transpacificus]|uniref:DNA repair-scaffolding protein isoform X2 n=1 Tax=Hypomesus transpacificus TaxID=137520 RepID=UPI001F081BB3|nr:DNA repair-scaffolding protein isoform X2 [Hypomesus transpacificus]
MAFVGKRKRYSKDTKLIFLPDDINGSKRVGRETSTSASSVSKSWEKCGDSFLDTPVIKNLWSSGKKSAVRQLATQSSHVLPGTAVRDEEPVHITWSSSESEQSDSEAQQPTPSLGRREPCLCPQIPARTTAPIQSYSRALRMLNTGADDLPAIDWDSEPSESEDEEKAERAISDCASGSCDEHPKETSNPTDVTDTEISDYASEGESTAAQGRTRGPALPTGQASERSASDWVRAAQAMLQTPLKQGPTHSMTPEDSSKKRRKFQSGGLAERLNRLQCRQRSAISFWRHQSISTGTTVDRPGVLQLEVLCVREESSMQLALCELQHQEALPGQHPQDPPFTSPGQGSTSPGQHPQDPTSPGRLLVLFSRETAAQLVPAPGDVVHVYPPWQSLVMEGENMTAILNTHFSQKVVSESRRARESVPRALLPVERLCSYSLTRSFCLLDMNHASNQGDTPATQVVAPQSGSSRRGLSVGCDSLLEAIEGLGQAGSVGQEVEVVVQRVYLSPLQERFPAAALRPKAPCRPPSHPAMPSARCRCPRLFNLIDSMWPPVVPIKVHGSTHSPEKGCRSVGPAPSFCYLLSGQGGSVEPIEGQAGSPLYCTPARHTLRHILQNKHEGLRVSFAATVVYKRKQNADADLAETWLAVTDPSLQGDAPGGGGRRTLALCLRPSCLLAPAVAQALLAPGACRLAVSDAVLENGVILCVEQSVVQLQSLVEAVCNADNTESSLLPTQARNQASSLPRPIRLDPLGPETTANSLCSLSGVIVGVDEDTAYSWPVCSRCLSDRLEIAQNKTQAFHCSSCDSTVDQPTIKMQLEAFISSSISDCTVKIKLQQSTIVSLLNSAKSDTEFPGYEVENVLGKEVGPLTAYVRVVTRKPALWIGLEEICLAEIGSVMGPSEINLWPQPNTDSHCRPHLQPQAQ